MEKDKQLEESIEKGGAQQHQHRHLEDVGLQPPTIQQENRYQSLSSLLLLLLMLLVDDPPTMCRVNEWLVVVGWSIALLARPPRNKPAHRYEVAKVVK